MSFNTYQKKKGSWQGSYHFFGQTAGENSQIDKNGGYIVFMVDSRENWTHQNGGDKMKDEWGLGGTKRATAGDTDNRKEEVTVRQAGDCRRRPDNRKHGRPLNKQAIYSDAE